MTTGNKIIRSDMISIRCGSKFQKQVITKFIDAMTKYLKPLINNAHTNNRVKLTLIDDKSLIGGIRSVVKENDILVAFRFVFDNHKQKELFQSTVDMAIESFQRFVETTHRHNRCFLYKNNELNNI